MSEERVTAIRQILIHHVGKKNAITSRQISEQLKIPENATHGSTRNLINKLIKTDVLPIGAFHGGYYVIETEDELKLEIAKFSRKIDSERKRMNRVKANYQAFHGKRNSALL